jgi:hypothetical protein
VGIVVALVLATNEGGEFEIGGGAGPVDLGDALGGALSGHLEGPVTHGTRVAVGDEAARERAESVGEIFGGDLVDLGCSGHLSSSPFRLRGDWRPSTGSG